MFLCTDACGQIPCKGPPPRPTEVNRKQLRTLTRLPLKDKACNVHTLTNASYADLSHGNPKTTAFWRATAAQSALSEVSPLVWTRWEHLMFQTSHGGQNET